MQLSVLKILLFSIIGLVGYYYVPQRYRKYFARSQDIICQERMEIVFGQM